MDVLFTTSTQVPTSLLMTGTKNAKKIKDKHFCSQIWQRPRLNNYKKKEKGESPKIFAHDSNQKKEKRESTNIFGCDNNKCGKENGCRFRRPQFFLRKTFKWKFWLIATNMRKETTNIFYSKKHIQEEERKSLKSWSPSPLEWSSSCPHLPSIWLPSSSNNAKTFVYGLSHNDIVIFRVYPDPPHLVIM